MEPVFVNFNDLVPCHFCSVDDSIVPLAVGVKPVVFINVSVPDAMLSVRLLPPAATITPPVFVPALGVVVALVHKFCASNTLLLVLDAAYTRPDEDCLLTHHCFGFVPVFTKTPAPFLGILTPSIVTFPELLVGCRPPRAHNSSVHNQTGAHITHKRFQFARHHPSVLFLLVQKRGNSDGASILNVATTTNNSIGRNRAVCDVTVGVFFRRMKIMQQSLYGFSLPIVYW